MQKLLIIGGHPKGYPKAFSPYTRSGKILHKLLTKHRIKAELIDLWENDEQERSGGISMDVLCDIERKCVEGYRIIVVGRHMHYHLIRQLRKPIEVHYLPHPASRTNRDRVRLEHGLCNLSVS
jgi:hypothetical protein